MTDLFQLPGPAVVEWLHESGHPVASVYAFVAHGITDTAVIDAHIGKAENLAALPDDARVTAADLDMLDTIGARAWVEDPENREDWAAVVAALEDLAAASDPRGMPSTRQRPPHDVVAAALDAGRGPTYVQKMIAAAMPYGARPDLFGFGISPTEFADLLSAGILWETELAAYRHVGLSIPEAVEFASEAIPPAAIMQAIREGIPRAEWRETLTGLPKTWFRSTVDGWHESEFTKWHDFIRENTSSRSRHEPVPFTLADLRYLADRGWGERDQLYVWGISLAMTPANSRAAADLGLTWAEIESYGKALNTGRPPDGPRDTSVPAIIGYGGGKAWGLQMDHLPLIAAMRDAGVRPSHITAYRSAGCRTMEHIIEAAKRGIDHKTAKRLTKTYGRRPSEYRQVRIIDSFAHLLRAHNTDLEKTP